MSEKAEWMTAGQESLEEQLAEYKTLQRELARLVTEKDHIVKNVGPQMEAELELKLGVLQFEVASLNSDIQRLKRKMELVLKHYQEGGGRPDEERLEAFEAQLEREFAGQKEATQGQFEKIVSARVLLDTRMPEEEWQRLRKVYRRLASRLHPAINPDLTPEYKTVWEYVSSAYRNGELEELETLATLLRSLPGEVTGAPDLENPGAGSMIRRRIEELKNTRRRMREQIRHMKRRHPYRLNYQPECSDSVEAQCRELEEQIRQLKNEKAAAELLLEAVLAGGGGTLLH